MTTSSMKVRSRCCHKFERRGEHCKVCPLILRHCREETHEQEERPTLCTYELLASGTEAWVGSGQEVA